MYNSKRYQKMKGSVEGPLNILSPYYWIAFMILKKSTIVKLSMINKNRKMIQISFKRNHIVALVSWSNWNSNNNLEMYQQSWDIMYSIEWGSKAWCQSTVEEHTQKTPTSNEISSIRQQPAFNLGLIRFWWFYLEGRLFLRRTLWNIFEWSLFLSHVGNMKGF